MTSSLTGRRKLRTTSARHTSSSTNRLSFRGGLRNSFLTHGHWYIQLPDTDNTRSILLPDNDNTRSIQLLDTDKIRSIQLPDTDNTRSIQLPDTNNIRSI